MHAAVEQVVAPCPVSSELAASPPAFLAELAEPPERVQPAWRGLVVDDDQSAAMSLRFALDSFGADTESSFSVTGARERLRSDRFDVVLTDYDMPDGGRRWLAELRARHPRLKVVVISGRSSDELARDRTHGLADAVLHKPADVDVVVAVVARILGLSEAAA